MEEITIFNKTSPLLTHIQETNGSTVGKQGKERERCINVKKGLSNI